MADKIQQFVIDGIFQLAGETIQNNTDRNRAAKGGVYTEKDILMEDMVKMLKSSHEQTNNQIRKCAESPVMSAEDQICEVMCIVANSEFDKSEIGFNLEYVHFKYPVSFQSKLIVADDKAREAYCNKENCSTPVRITALKIRFFCTLLQFYNQPGHCLKILQTLIASIPQDRGMASYLLGIKWHRIPLVGESDADRNAVLKFYEHLREGICKLARVWGKECQCLFDAFDQLRMAGEKVNTVKKKGFNMNGFVLSQIFDNRLVILVAAEQICHIDKEKQLLVFNFTRKTTLKIDLDNFKVKVFEGTANFSEYVEKESAEDKFRSVIFKQIVCGSNRASQPESNDHSTSSSMLSSMFSNMNLTNQISSAHMGNIITKNGHLIDLKETRLCVRWSNSEEMLFEFNNFPPKFVSKFNLMTQSSPRTPISSRLLLLDAHDGQKSMSVSVAVEMKFFDHQEIWKIVCHRKKGIKSADIVVDFNLGEHHSARWSNASKQFEVAYVDENETAKLKLAQVSENVTRNSDRLILKNVGDLFPPSFQDETNWLRVKQILLTDNFVFVALHVVETE